jgi:hypothetical protein
MDWENTIADSDVIILEVNEAAVIADYATAFVSDALKYLRNILAKP